MTTLQKQKTVPFMELFAECDEAVQEVIADVIRFELENIHLKEPRYKSDFLNILERVARNTLKDDDDEA